MWAQADSTLLEKALEAMQAVVFALARTASQTLGGAPLPEAPSQSRLSNRVPTLQVGGLQEAAPSSPGNAIQVVPRRPLSGDPCADEGQKCEYGALCEGVSFGPSMVCQHGNWAQAGEIAGCPLEWACAAPQLQLMDGGRAD
jgi:hypothetical protein